jgi:beta-xylosidase
MQITYCNPIIDKYLADPFILADSGVYYLFATGPAGDRRFLPVHRSTDLVHWQFIRGAVAQGPEGSWNRKNFWAPEVIKINDLYYLYYTASTDGTPENTGNRVGLAVAGTPEGPYEDRGVVIPHASIDGSPFIGDDGAMYLYYTIEHGNADGLKAGHIYVAPMDSAQKPRDTAPTQLVYHHPWQEGPCMLHRNGVYYLTYSTGDWTNDTYKVQWATGLSPVGPFTEQAQIILSSNQQVKGPGHHNLFKTPSGGDWMIYHGWDTAHRARYPRIDPLITDNSMLQSNGPTFTPQHCTL